jgi:hypothetical protein
MNSIQKRFILFLTGCIGSRALLVLIAKTIQLQSLPLMGYGALIPAIGFTYIYLSGSRKTGGEVFGDKIWWNDLRPIHAFLYFTFAFKAINREPSAWVYLAIDVIIGFISFIRYHYASDNFAKLFTV